MSTRNKLTKQVKLVLKILEENNRDRNGLNNGIISLIYCRYINALSILEKNENAEGIVIAGGVRAYLDAYNNYDNLLLEAMHKAEKSLEKLLKEGML
ncbi:hypothetical protein [Terribacillus sp. DMT04]|uniref:hypothetical protein n=1 Tax=Terribacillus sp. DMT04 TaxID=2850441 RepID=UPI001C2C2C9D|nr:hypothetical protein [Terribacillus sp. DMT04]QXE01505.1 hypothetical protein KS242_16255 [Terribacillus sp. DMT04]